MVDVSHNTAHAASEGLEIEKFYVLTTPFIHRANKYYSKMEAHNSLNLRKSGRNCVHTSADIMACMQQTPTCTPNDFDLVFLKRAQKYSMSADSHISCKNNIYSKHVSHENKMSPKVMIKIPRELFLTSVILDSNKYIKCVE
jgi:hypothetical protein